MEVLLRVLLFLCSPLLLVALLFVFFVIIPFLLSCIAYVLKAWFGFWFALLHILSWNEYFECLHEFGID